MINGKRYSWEDVTVNLPTGVAVDIDSIEYSDEKEFEESYGRGSNPRGYGSGNYKAEGKITLLKEEHDKMIAYTRSQGRSLYKLPPFPIVVNYANEDQPSSTDILKQCKISKVSHSTSQGDKDTKVEYDIKIFGGIFRNGLAPN